MKTRSRAVRQVHVDRPIARICRQQTAGVYLYGLPSRGYERALGPRRLVQLAARVRVGRRRFCAGGFFVGGQLPLIAAETNKQS